MNKQAVYNLIAKYFDKIIIDYYKSKYVIRCWNSPVKHPYACNFYQVIVSTKKRIFLVMGHIDGEPYEKRFKYKNIDHLEYLINQSYIQNCYYATKNTRTYFEFKEKGINNEK